MVRYFRKGPARGPDFPGAEHWYGRPPGRVSAFRKNAGMKKGPVRGPFNIFGDYCADWFAAAAATKSARAAVRAVTRGWLPVLVAAARRASISFRMRP